MSVAITDFGELFTFFSSVGVSSLLFIAELSSFFKLKKSLCSEIEQHEQEENFNKCISPRNQIPSPGVIHPRRWIVSPSHLRYLPRSMLLLVNPILPPIRIKRIPVTIIRVIIKILLPSFPRIAIAVFSCKKGCVFFFFKRTGERILYNKKNPIYLLSS